MNDDSNPLHSLHREVAQLRFLVVMLLMVGLGFLTLVNLAAITTVPRFERIFEEMLGSRDKLPQLTKLVVYYGRMAGGLGAYGITLMVPGLAMLGLLLGSRTRVIPIMCVLVMVFQVIHLVVLNLALYLPLFTIMQGVGERTS